MILNRLSTRWLMAPPVTGLRAHLCAIAALAIPSLIRFSVDGIVTGSAFGTFVPFVLLSALLLGWRHAAVIAVAAAAIVDFAFVTPNALLDGVSDLFGIGTFLLSSALIIGLVELARSARREAREAQPSNECPHGIIFSLEDGEALASWPGAGGPVRLGPQQEVAGMMEEFLAQLEVGQRLTRRCGIARASAEPARPAQSFIGL